MLNSVEHETLNAHKYKNISKIVFLFFFLFFFIVFFFRSDKPRMLFFPFIRSNGNNCWHFNIYEREKFMLN